MKVRKLVGTILTFGLILILFVSLPYTGLTSTYAAENALTAKLNVNSQSVVKGKSFYLRVYNLKDNQTVSFTSSKTSVATVDSSGKVKAVSTGTADISAKIYDNGKLTDTLNCQITVGPPAVAIMISKLSLTLHVGQKAKLSYIIFPINTAETPIFSSNDEKVARVSAGGTVTAESIGTTTIFCKIASGKYAKCVVNVVADDVIIDEDSEEISLDDLYTVASPELLDITEDTDDSPEAGDESAENSGDKSESENQNPFLSFWENLFKRN